MRDLNPRDSRLRVFETRALGRYANPPLRSLTTDSPNYFTNKVLAGAISGTYVITDDIVT